MDLPGMDVLTWDEGLTCGENMEDLPVNDGPEKNMDC